MYEFVVLRLLCNPADTRLWRSSPWGFYARQPSAAPKGCQTRSVGFHPRAPRRTGVHHPGPGIPGTSHRIKRQFGQLRRRSRHSIRLLACRRKPLRGLHRRRVGRHRTIRRIARRHLLGTTGHVVPYLVGGHRFDERLRRCDCQRLSRPVRRTTAPARPGR